MNRRLWILALLAALAGTLWLQRWQLLPLYALLFPVQAAQPGLRLEPAFGDLRFDRPLYLTHAPGDARAVYVVTQPGRIFRVALGASSPAAESFLDMADAVSTAGAEEGLLGLAFAPDYAHSRRYFVYYSARPGARRTVLARIDSDGRRTVLREFAQPYANHNGGWIGFGPDGFLYVALGDGGSADDPGHRAQNLGELLGKVLRLDGDGKPAPGNPFEKTPGARAEIWAWGLRNPWRMGFDRATGELWAGDVGQNQVEEVDVIVRGGNYGWRHFEGGRENVNPEGRKAGEFIAPVLTYDHSVGQSITGGYVYRGEKIPKLAGQYVFGDFVQGRLFALDAARGERAVELGRVPLLASFGEDADGELYLCSFDGRIYRLVPA